MNPFHLSAWEHQCIKLGEGAKFCTNFQNVDAVKFQMDGELELYRVWKFPNNVNSGRIGNRRCGWRFSLITVAMDELHKYVLIPMQNSNCKENTGYVRLHQSRSSI